MSWYSTLFIPVLYLYLSDVVIFVNYLHTLHDWLSCGIVSECILFLILLQSSYHINSKFIGLQIQCDLNITRIYKICKNAYLVGCS